MKVFQKLSDMGIPYQTPRLILPGWTRPPDGYRRWLRLRPFRAGFDHDGWFDVEGWELTNKRMNDHILGTRCEHCPTHVLWIASRDEPRRPRHVGSVCDECGHLLCWTDFNGTDGPPWTKLRWRPSDVVWLGNLVGNLHEEFLEWFRGPPALVMAPSAGPYR